ncbi:major histocompatibility complex class I-related gene protein [Labeo rohita]|uniref:major histocompatibility complex class I-related gene protein n=1 Tax=Labeo rohita TaxID=84645 RepID=UPI0021E2145E|nr:major histocompatibility complex class I-related gene protein [Labeo rohita]
MTARIPEISSVTTLDEQQIDYYDSDTGTPIPRQDWIKKFGDRFKKYIEIRERVQQINKIDIAVLMQQFNQSHGVHTYQRMYGCDWDDDTGGSHVFDEHGYDGEDFISLDVKELTYTAHVPQAKPTVLKWNNDRKQLDFLKNYDPECIYWLRVFLDFSKTAFNKTEPPMVSLLKKNQDYYVLCHVTGFHFRETNILWRTNGLKNFSKLVEYREMLPNGDGTFQRTVALKFLPDDWKTNQYACVVEHESLTEPIQKNLTVDDIKSNGKRITYFTPPPASPPDNGSEEHLMWKTANGGSDSPSGQKRCVTGVSEPEANKNHSDGQLARQFPQLNRSETSEQMEES